MAIKALERTERMTKGKIIGANDIVAIRFAFINPIHRFSRFLCAHNL
jgi:hypothetical protein